MNRRVVRLQLVIFSVQWSLMLIGFGLLAWVIAPTQLFPSDLAYAREVDSALKAGVALTMSVFWLYIWDRQVRWLIYWKEK